MNSNTHKQVRRQGVCLGGQNGKMSRWALRQQRPLGVQRGEGDDSDILWRNNITIMG